MMAFAPSGLLPKRLDARFIVIRQLSIGVDNNFKHFVEQ